MIPDCLHKQGKPVPVIPRPYVCWSTSGSSSNLMLCSHAFTSSAPIPNAPPAHLLESPATATLISASLGVSSLTGIGLG